MLMGRILACTVTICVCKYVISTWCNGIVFFEFGGDYALRNPKKCYELSLTGINKTLLVLQSAFRTVHIEHYTMHKNI